MDQNCLIFRWQTDAQTCKRGPKDKVVNLPHSLYSQGNPSQLFSICCTHAVLPGITRLTGITLGIGPLWGINSRLPSPSPFLVITSYHNIVITCQNILSFSFIVKPDALSMQSLQSCILIERFTRCNLQLAIQIGSRKLPSYVWVLTISGFRFSWIMRNNIISLSKR